MAIHRQECAPLTRWPAWLMSGIVTAAFANALWFARTIANPMIMADNWPFVDTFLRHVIDEPMTFGDFLVKRTGLDHGLPLYKLLMLLNAKFLGLDFTFEAMAGVMFALLGWMTLYRIAASDAPGRQRPLSFCLVMAAIAAVYLSLNAFYLYLYSMVTLTYLSHLLAFAVIYTAWRALDGSSLLAFAVAALIYAVAADTSAMLTAIAVATALGWVGWHRRNWRRVLQLLAVLAAAVVSARLLYITFGEIRGDTSAVWNVPLSSRVEGLTAQWRDSWRWVITPLASGLACKDALRNFFGDGWQLPQLLLGAGLIAAHLWFWRCAWKHSPRAASFAAVCLMLLFYAYVAGVLYGRVFLVGSRYLDQQRYVAFYQIGIISLLLMVAARVLHTPWRGRTRLLAASIAALIVVLQVPLTVHSWAQAPGILGYYRVMAVQYGEVLRDPAPSRVCVDQLKLCDLPSDIRVRVIDMLRRHQLNLYSPQFRKRHPDLAADAKLPVDQ